MGDFKFIRDYKNIDEYRLSFNELAKVTFGIDFEKWYQMGFWNDRYICYSYVQGGRVVSNVSVNIMELIINGQRKKAVQIGTVMTHSEYRKRGLAGSLMKIVLEEYEDKCDFIYLFPNEEVLDFYLKFGFISIQESTLSKDISINRVNENILRKLEISNKDDLNILKKLVMERIPNSSALGADKAEHILTWYLVNAFSDKIYYLEDRDIAVVFDTEGERLNFYDVIASREVDLNEILNIIADCKTKKVIFHFTPSPEYIGECRKVEGVDDLMFIKGSINGLPEYFRHPITAHA